MNNKKSEEQLNREELKSIRKFKKKQWKKRKQARLAGEKKSSRSSEDKTVAINKQPNVVEKKDASMQFNAADVSPASHNPNTEKNPGNQHNESNNYQVRTANTHSRGKDMVRASLQRERTKQPAKPTERKRKAIQTLSTAEDKKAKIEVPLIKELDQSLIKRVKGESALGSGSYGTCYLARYRNITVAVKEFNDRGGRKLKPDLRRSALKEAEIIVKLGDHRGLPLLFGVCTKVLPVSLVLLFHGERDTSLTVFKATRNNPPLTETQWNIIFYRIAKALEHVHSKSFIHNDLKGNNVVLEPPVDDEAYNPVIIDFGCSLKVTDAKPRRPQPHHLKEVNKTSYIAPEIVDGSGPPSYSSDVYSFGRMIEFVYKRCHIALTSIISKTLSDNPAARPSLEELTAYFGST